MIRFYLFCASIPLAMATPVSIPATTAAARMNNDGFVLNFLQVNFDMLARVLGA